MIARVNGWFIHRSVHPVSFGIGSVIRKPVVVNDEVKVREILNMTILVDHDLVDRVPMVRQRPDKQYREGRLHLRSIRRKSNCVTGLMLQ